LSMRVATSLSPAETTPTIDSARPLSERDVGIISANGAPRSSSSSITRIRHEQGPTDGSRIATAGVGFLLTLGHTTERIEDQSLDPEASTAVS
jgi:hypothetical protein